jgi:hypothetical protein
MTLTIQSDMVNVFLNSGFEESISYTPSGGAAKTIDAVVFREGSRQHEDTIGRGTRTNQRQYDIEILISNDATDGIATVIPREDTVSVAKRPGEAAQTFLVASVIQSDEGAWRLGLGS